MINYKMPFKFLYFIEKFLLRNNLFHLCDYKKEVFLKAISKPLNGQ